MGKRLHSVWYVTRRVGVTARLRQIGGNQVTGSPQIATEMAGSTPCIKNTNGHRSSELRQSADGSMATVALESTDRRQSENGNTGQRNGAPGGAHEALPHTPPGDTPPETP